MSNEFDIKVQNVVAFTALGKPVSLSKILSEVEDTEWQPETFPGLIYRITNPRASALIFSQGKIVCTGTRSAEDAKSAMQKIVNRIRKAGMKVPTKFNMKVENIVASSKVKGNINLEEIAFALENSEYEPEQFPGLVYRVKSPRVAFLLFSSGRVICTGARNTKDIQTALQIFRKDLKDIGVKVTPVSC